MATPTFDAIGAGANVSATSCSWSHTCTGTNLILFAIFNLGGVGDMTGFAATYNGVAMTLWQTVVSSGKVLAICYLIAPATGAHTLAASWTTSQNCRGNSVSYTAVHQTYPLGTFASATDDTGGSTTPSIAVASAATHELVIDFLSTNAARTYTQTGTSRIEYPATPSSYVGSQEKAGAASVTMNWTLSSATNWKIGGVSLHSTTYTHVANGGFFLWMKNIERKLKNLFQPRSTAWLPT